MKVQNQRNKLIQQKTKLDLARSKESQVVQVFAIGANPNANIKYWRPSRWGWNLKGESGATICASRGEGGGCAEGRGRAQAP